MAENRTTNNNNAARSRKIALNSLFLFLRFAFLMVLDLLAMRYVLRGLGETDFGIYSAVASVILTGACIKPVLSLSIQRYFSYALGEKDTSKFSEIYSASLNITLALILIFLVVLESVGLYFFFELTIPAERLDAAMWVFQSSLVAFLFTVIQIPFMAAIFAHEDMGAYSIISAAECVLKFLVALYIVYTGLDGLIFYSIALMAVTIVTWLAYATYAKIRYAECTYRLRCKTRNLYRELLSFSSWTLYGAVAGMGMIQGGAILLNIFFGPIANAAFGIALTIYNAFTAVTNSIVVAFRPAMIKAYAEKQFEYLNKTFNIGNRAILYLLLTVAIPMIFEMPYVLKLWLGNYPDDTVLFARLIIVFAIILALNNPITTIIQANGDIKKYFLLVETITIMNVPVTWIIFKAGAPSYAIFLIMAGLCAVAHVLRLYCLKQQFQLFSYRNYCKALLLPGFATVIACSSVAYLIHNNLPEGFWRAACSLCSVGVVLVAIVLLLGLTSNERSAVSTIISSKFRH